VDSLGALYQSNGIARLIPLNANYDADTLCKNILENVHVLMVFCDLPWVRMITLVLQYLGDIAVSGARD
jgi:hypothetical protein